MYLFTETPFTVSADWEGLIQVVVVPRPDPMFAKPQVAEPETLMKESVPVVPEVKTKPFVVASYATFTPDTVLPFADASWLIPFSSSTIKLSNVYPELVGRSCSGRSFSASY